MILTSYWWLLIWLFVGTMFYKMPKQPEYIEGKVVYRWSWLAAIGLVLPYIIWAAFREGGADTLAYRTMFLNESSNVVDIPMLFIDDVKDPGYTALMILFKSVFGNQEKLFFLLIATLQIWCITYVFRKYSSDFWVSFFLFIVSTDYISWMWNGMRQFIAVAIVFCCFEWMLQKKYVPLIIVIVLASFIHGSAMLMIPVVFLVQGEAWNKKTIIMLIVTMVVMVFVDRFTPILNDLLQNTQYDDVMTNEIWTVDDGANIIRVLVYSVPAFVSLVGLKYIRRENDSVINLCVNCSIVTMALYLVASVTSGIYIGRLPIYTTLQGYIALPWLIDHMFSKNSARTVKTLMIIFFAVFFYYQIFIVWG